MRIRVDLVDLGNSLGSFSRMKKHDESEKGKPGFVFLHLDV